MPREEVKSADAWKISGPTAVRRQLLDHLFVSRRAPERDYSVDCNSGEGRSETCVAGRDEHVLVNDVEICRRKRKIGYLNHFRWIFHEGIG